MVFWYIYKYITISIFHENYSQILYVKHEKKTQNVTVTMFCFSSHKYKVSFQCDLFGNMKQIASIWIPPKYEIVFLFHFLYKVLHNNTKMSTIRKKTPKNSRKKIDIYQTNDPLQQNTNVGGLLYSCLYSKNNSLNRSRQTYGSKHKDYSLWLQIFGFILF